METPAATPQAERRILEYAFLAFGQQGFHNVTLDSVAKALHVSKKTLYKFFHSKDELLERAASLQFEIFEERAAKISLTVSGGQASFLSLCKLHLQFQQTFPPALMAEITEAIPHLAERISLFEATSLRKRMSKLLKAMRNAELAVYPSPTRELVDSWCRVLRNLDAMQEPHFDFIVGAFFKGISKPLKKKKNK